MSTTNSIPLAELFSKDRTIDLVARWERLGGEPIDRWRRGQRANQLRRPRPVEPNQTQALGEEVTQRIAARLQAMGYRVRGTPHKAPFDLIVDDCLKVEVKSAHWTARQHETARNAGRFQAGLGRRQKREADVVILACKNESWPHFVIPATEISGVTIAITSYHVEVYRGQYACFLEAWVIVGQALSQAQGRPHQMSFEWQGGEVGCY